VKARVGLLLVGLALVVGLVALLGSGFGKDPHRLPSTMVGKVAPDFALVDLDGAPVQLSALRGTPVVLNFWATWCMPCKAEHPLLVAAARARPDVRFFGVVYGDQPDAVRRYLAKAGTSYPHLVDPGDGVAVDYGVAGVPESFFVDRQGVIVHKQAGPLDAATLTGLLARLETP
jgi:cytochrome c biogenesis protein CcmG/thiol:disulfide interchange protein DsbE